MTIDVQLSTESINKAIQRLKEAKDNLETGVAELVDILTQDGADVASAFIGSMATVDHETDGKSTGKITVSGEAAVIQEFGAGDLTMTGNPFENSPGVPVYPGSYSETEGSGEYAATGKWHFGGKEYQYVEPRRGLQNARDYIRDHATETAQKVIQL